LRAQTHALICDTIVLVYFLYTSLIIKKIYFSNFLNNLCIWSILDRIHQLFDLHNISSLHDFYSFHVDAWVILLYIGMRQVRLILTDRFGQIITPSTFVSPIWTLRYTNYMFLHFLLTIYSSQRSYCRMHMKKNYLTFKLWERFNLLSY
jgi:hypothetical protein